jgi:OOP family OmpA-OmpF porin
VHRTTYFLIAILLPLVFADVGRAQKPDAKGSIDHPLLTRMPNYYIYRYSESEFDAVTVNVDGKDTSVEGRKLVIDYQLNEGVNPPSRLQVVRNYENAIKQLGGVPTYRPSSGDVEHFRVERPGKHIWILLDAYHANDYHLTFLEEQGMRQDVRAGAASWMADIGSTGHAAVYGIYFDTDQAVIKPESAPVLSEIVALLQKNPKLNVHLVGHTDSTGLMDHNLKLSAARAAAVVNALVTQHGIAAARLKASGVGPLSPVASNRTEEGRARNRRVELVEQ